MAKPLTVLELRDLLNGGYSRESIAAVLHSRGINKSVSAKDVVSLINPASRIQEPKTLFDIQAQHCGNMRSDRFIERQERLTLGVWLPLALATICTVLCANKGIKLSTDTFLSAWGLHRLARITRFVPDKKERDEAFLKFAGL